MMYNENKFADVILLKLDHIVNVFLVRFRTITLQTQEIKITLVQRCFNVVTLNNIELRLFRPPVFSGYYLNADTGLLMSTRYPMQKEFPCNPFKNLEAVTESCSLKKKFF